jgi:hypothetical protein
MTVKRRLGRMGECGRNMCVNLRIVASHGVRVK